MPTSPITSASFKQVLGATSDDIVSLNTALAYLSSSQNGLSILSNSVNSQVTIQIYKGDNGGNFNWYDPVNKILYWNPDLANLIKDSAGNVIGVQSAAIGLVHEDIHAEDSNYATELNTPDSSYGTAAERVAIEGESTVATDLGEVTRSNHFGTPVVEADPTEHSLTNSDGSLTYVQVDISGATINDGSTLKGFEPSVLPTTRLRTH